MLALLLSLLIAVPDAPATVIKPLTVCEVIANDPTKLNGKVIKVRGILGETDEGIWLIGECKTQLLTKGVAWGNSLSVYVDLSDMNIARSWEQMGVKVRQRRADAGRDKIWVTVVGRMETRSSMDEEVLETSHGLVKMGFGHLSGSPAEINVLSVEDVSVEGGSAAGSGCRRR